MKLGKSIVRSDIYDMMSNGEYSPINFISFTISEKSMFYNLVKIKNMW